jgi:hypothetical protein
MQGSIQANRRCVFAPESMLPALLRIFLLIIRITAELYATDPTPLNPGTVIYMYNMNICIHIYVYIIIYINLYIYMYMYIVWNVYRCIVYAHAWCTDTHTLTHSHTHEEQVVKVI